MQCHILASESSSFPSRWNFGVKEHHPGLVRMPADVWSGGMLQLQHVEMCGRRKPSEQISVRVFCLSVNAVGAVISSKFVDLQIETPANPQPKIKETSNKLTLE